jgi:uncharacterized membrane protein
MKQQSRAAAIWPGTGWAVFWASILAASVWFMIDSAGFVMTRDYPEGTTVWNRLIWYGAHIVVASPVLFIAPLQFVAAIRQSRPTVHRWLGRYFLGASMIAAPLGIWLGTKLENEGSRVPIALLGVVWFCFSAIAWQCARRKDFASHRKYVIRSFALGLAFVWIRIIDETSAVVLGFIPDEASRSTTQEWLAFVLPLLVVETWLSWGPSWRNVR